MEAIFNKNNLLLAFKRIDREQIDEIGEKPDERHVEDEEKKYILCRVCRNVVTDLSSRTEINGSHMHVFKNPLGIVFQIGCFQATKGCKREGVPTVEYTWFPGYSWRYALCSNCFFHLGWFYQSNGNIFYGLILDHLIESE